MATPHTGTSDTPTPEDVIKICALCQQDQYDPQILPCMHIVCANCIQSHKARSKAKFACPICEFAVPNDNGSQPYRNCSFAKLHLEQTNEKRGVSAKQRPTSANERTKNEETDKRAKDRESSDEEMGHNKVEEEHSEEWRKSDRRVSASENGFRDSSDTEHASPNARDDHQHRVSTSILAIRLNCSSHPQHEANTFCNLCHVPICDKCMVMLHRRCKDYSPLNKVVEEKRPELDKIHGRLSVLSLNLQNQLKTKQVQLMNIQHEKEDVEKRIASFTEEVIKTIHAQEGMLLDDLNSMYDKEVTKVTEQLERDMHGLSCLDHSLEVFECALSMGAEGEIVQDLPRIQKRVDLYEQELTGITIPPIHATFEPNSAAFDTVPSLGKVNVFCGHNNSLVDTSAECTGTNKKEWSFNFRLMISYHGSTRDDTTQPLLTDAVLLANGDVILTDRDNKSLKKFNRDGKLLTNVEIPEIPSRLAIVSGSKVVVSCMSKKVLLFFSLHGTMRVLTRCKTAKQYSFVSCTSDDLLLVSTNNCDSIDVITQTGKFLRTLYTSEKAVLSRPIYLNANSDGTILISDSSRKCLLALTEEGDQSFKYKSSEDNSLECPLGVTSDPDGYILLADRDTNKIHLVSSCGEFLKIIPNDDLPVEKPCALYLYKGEKLVLTQVDGTIKVFSCVG